MLPIGPMMTEHRLIEGMIALLNKELGRLRDSLARDPDNPQVDAAFLDAVVDFFRIYADKTHHGKEEDVLFAACHHKELSPEHRRLMKELQEEHQEGRRITARLLQARENHLKGDRAAVQEIVETLALLTDLYPPHIDKEDNHFFHPSMDYFTPAEKAKMLAQMWEFDRKMIHLKYQAVLGQWRARM